MQCIAARRCATSFTSSLLRRSSPRHASLERYSIIHCYFTTIQLQSTPHGVARPYSTSRNSLQEPSHNTQSPNIDKELTSPPPHHENYSPFYRRLALSLPHSIHRPTKDDFLKVADGFWARARIRFKWFTIRSFRRFGADDISAFITWFLMSQTVWLFVGTTTFFSVIFATANSLRLQEYVARALSDYLTSETGIQITFESAIVPKWKDSRISFKNVSISQNVPGNNSAPNPNEGILQLRVDSIDVTMSLARWFDGKGLIQDAIIKGVRGVVDRRFLIYDPTLLPSDFRHPPTPGSFHLTSLSLQDILVTLYQPLHRPFTVSIFNATINTLRKQWLVYDLLSEAEGMVGMFDGCLFSLHRPQMVESGMVLQDGSKMSRLRIDGVNISHIQSMSSPNSPISWIKSGKVDAVLDFHFPHDPASDIDFNTILSEIATNISSAAQGQYPFDTVVLKGDKSGRAPGQKELARPPLTAPEHLNEVLDLDRNLHPRGVGVDIDLRFRDIKAAVPLFQSELSYTNSALIRPIVAFMNANRTLIPIRCHVSKDLGDFDGSWTLWQTGLMDDISLKVHDALAYHVAQANMNRRLKTVSLWSLLVTANSAMAMVKNILDPASTHIRDMYLQHSG